MLTSISINFLFAKWSRKKEKKCEISYFAFREKNSFSISFFFHEKRIFFWGIFLFTCEKKRDFFWISFFTRKKSEKNEFLFIKKSKISDFLWEEKRFSFYFSLRKKKISITLFSWEKKRDFFEFSFPHVGREETVFLFPFSTITLSIRSFIFELSQIIRIFINFNKFSNKWALLILI